eukprot:993870-Amphidinium_carterae.1
MPPTVAIPIQNIPQHPFANGMSVQASSQDDRHVATLEEVIQITHNHPRPTMNTRHSGEVARCITEQELCSGHESKVACKSTTMNGACWVSNS